MKSLLLRRVLQSQGFGTRKWCTALIKQGHVSIGGETITDINASVSLDNLELCVFGDAWRYREKVYLALNKPVGFECTRKGSHPSVISLLPEPLDLRKVQPVGRLDLDTTGLLLLSDDGDFIHRQSSPKHHVPKIYIATTFEPVSATLVEQLLTGVKLHDEPQPLAAVSCRQIGSHQLEIILKQGKYHQVKRMLVAAGNHCEALHRPQIGQLTLDSLQLNEGEWCYLEEPQLNQLTGQH